MKKQKQREINNNSSNHVEHYTPEEEKQIILDLQDSREQRKIASIKIVKHTCTIFTVLFSIGVALCLTVAIICGAALKAAQEHPSAAKSVDINSLNGAKTVFIVIMIILLVMIAAIWGFYFYKKCKK